MGSVNVKQTNEFPSTLPPLTHSFGPKDTEWHCFSLGFQMFGSSSQEPWASVASGVRHGRGHGLESQMSEGANVKNHWSGVWGDGVYV